MPSLYRYKGYTVSQVGLSHHIWRDFVTVSALEYGRPRGPHGYAQSKAEALRWINSDRGLMTPVESGWIEAIGYVPLTAEARAKYLTTLAVTRALCAEETPVLLPALLTPRVGFVLVRLKSGKLSAYLCPSWTYGALLRSKSKGKAFHRLVKGHPEVLVPAGLITE